MKDIKKLREERGMSQNQLAKQSGLAQSTINNIERKKPNLNLHTINQLAKGLNVTAEYLLKD